MFNSSRRCRASRKENDDEAVACCRSGDRLVVGRAGRRLQAFQFVRYRDLLYALARQARRLRGKIQMRAGRELRRDPGGPLDRGDHQHHAQQCSSRNHPAGGRRRQARLSRQADRQHRGGGPGDRARLREGRRRAGARLSAPARKPFPLDQGRDRRRPFRQAGAGRRQYQPRPARQDRSVVLALSGQRHAGRRHAADRHSLCRRAGNADGPGQAGVRHVEPAGAARRQSGRRQSHSRTRERRDFEPDGVLRLGVGILHDEHLRQGSDRLLRPVQRPAPSQARREQAAADRDRKRTTPFARSSTSSSLACATAASRKPTASGPRAIWR